MIRRSTMTGLAGAMLLPLLLSGCLSSRVPAAEETHVDDAGVAGAGTGTPEPSADAVRDPSSTVTIDGEEYVCEELIGLPLDTACWQTIQVAFNLYKDRVDQFVSHAGLGPVGSLYDKGRIDYGQVAYLGLAACEQRLFQGDQFGYVDEMQKEFAELGLDDVAFVTTWLKAGQIICPDASTGEGDKVTP